MTIERKKFEGISIFLLLILSAALASFITGVFWSAFSERHFPETIFDHIRSGAQIVPFALIITSPVLIGFAQPICFHLYYEDWKAMYWFILLTLLAFLYAIPWWIGSNFNTLLIILFTSTGFFTSIIVWFFLTKVRISNMAWFLIAGLFFSLIYYADTYVRPLTEEQKKNIEKLELDIRD